MANSTLWSAAGIALVAAAIVTPLREDLMAMAQPSPEDTYLACLTSEIAAANPKSSVRRMVPAYKNCATHEVAYRTHLMNQGVRAERVDYVVSRVMEASYARYTGASADRHLGCFERQMVKASRQVIS